ncbi:MAG: hypothetical protein JKY65_23210 [Planctomycetes bacterium]|nr:hypothetical protein [Planctomycetota bacterium]
MKKQGKNNTAFNVGDKVRLNTKPNTPIMQVKEIVVPSDIEAVTTKRLTVIKCQWFDRNKLLDGEFSPESLVPA